MIGYSNHDTFVSYSLEKEYSMQGSVESQVVQRDSQMLPPDRASGVQSLPLQDLFEQLHTSEQGLTEQEAQRRLSEIGPNETAGV